MKNIASFLCLSFLISLNGRAQVLECDNIFSWLLGDKLKYITQLSNGKHLAIGTRLGAIDVITGQPYNILCEINEFCDTVWCRNTEVYGVGTLMVKLKNDHLFMMTFEENRNGLNKVWLARLAESGRSVRKRVIRAHSFNFVPETAIEGPSGSIILASYCVDTGTGANVIGLSRIDTSGVVYWSRIVADHPRNNFCSHIEPTPEGTYIMSGTAGSRIWAMEFDSNGTELRRQTFYQTPSRSNFENATVQQAPDGRFIVSGNYYSSLYKFYIGRHLGWTVNKDWGGEQNGYMVSPIILDDGSMVSNNSAGQINSFTKVNADSLVQWSTPLPYSTPFTGVQIYSYVFNQDSSTTAVGYYNNVNSFDDEDFFVARISGVGVPYDPTTPVATKPQQGSKGGISIWPQPASNANGGTLHFGGFAGPATLGLYNMRGQQVLLVPGTTGTAPTTLLPRQPVPIGHLPPGLYVYRLVARDRVWTGKVVVE